MAHVDRIWTEIFAAGLAHVADGAGSIREYRNPLTDEVFICTVRRFQHRSAILMAKNDIGRVGFVFTERVERPGIFAVEIPDVTSANTACVDLYFDEGRVKWEFVNIFHAYFFRSFKDQSFHAALLLVLVRTNYRCKGTARRAPTNKDYSVQIIKIERRLSRV